VDEYIDGVKNPLYDIRVRYAVSHAIDRQDITDALGFGIWKPATQLTNVGYAGRLPADHPIHQQAVYDPAKAKELLAEAGYPNRITIPLRAQAIFNNQIVAIQGMLSQVGINTEVEFPEPGRITELGRTGWDGLLGFNWGQVMNTGISFYIWWHPEITDYVSVIRPNPEYSEAYYAARRYKTVDNDMFARLDEMAMELQAFVPVYHTNTVFFIRNGLTDGGFKEYAGDTSWIPWNAYWKK
jgi:peptide/nickel transport system substrate-binding protein